MTPTAAREAFFVAGGTLPCDAPSYVERRADHELHAALTQAEYCHVLTSRQMGKSSLMVRTAAKLRRAGTAVVVLDLTAVGQNLTAEQWYDGLLGLLARSLDLEDELETFWLSHRRLGPLQRWMAALGEVVLPRVPGPVVLFVDEIDAVRSLPFSADEFFAAIRECYNRRSEHPAYARLTFCLLGVATPGDLIRDTRTTPFNVGRRIVLTDFTLKEARPLTLGIGRDQREAPWACPRVLERVLERILHWTAGHPYLTQRLFVAVSSASEADLRSPEQLVDRASAELFLSRGARISDDNLVFVRERLLRSEADLGGLLQLYRRVLKGVAVTDDGTNRLVSILLLSGVVRSRGGRLEVRNQIYRRVFDDAWIAAHTPDAELRRQQAAYRRGVVRATALGGVVVGLVGALAWTSYRSAAETRRLAEERQRALVAAQNERDQAGDLLYASQMNLAHLAYKEGKLSRAWRLLEQHSRVAETDRRGFVWRYLWRLCRSAHRTSFSARAEVTSVAFSRDGLRMAFSAADGAVEIRDVADSALRDLIRAHAAGSGITFSPDGRFLATAGTSDGKVKLWDLTLRPAALRREFPGLRRRYPRVLFTPDGKTLIAGSTGDRIRLWDLSTRGGHRTIPVAAAGAVALSPDGSILAVYTSGTEAGRVMLWSIAGGRPPRLVLSIPPGEGLIECLAFSPDGRLIVAGGSGRIQCWDTRKGQLVKVLPGHEGPVLTVAFAPDGSRLASCGLDHTIRLWDVRASRLVGILHGHSARVGTLAFAPRRSLLISGSADTTSRLWSIDPQDLRTAANERTESAAFTGARGSLGSVVFSADGRSVLEVRSGAPLLRELSAGGGSGSVRRVGSERSSRPMRLRFGAAMSRDGNLLAYAAPGGVVHLRSLPQLQLTGVLNGHGSEVTEIAFVGEDLLVTASGGGSTGARASTRLWRLSPLRQVTVLPGDSSVPQAPVAVSSDGRRIAVMTPERRVALWEPIGTGPPPVTTMEGSTSMLALAFSPDGRLLAGGSTEGFVYVWNAATGKQLRRLVGHVGGVLSVAFSPDGRTLATGGMDHTLRLWNPRVDQEEATLTGHTAWVWSVAFSPDGNTLATGSLDGTLRLWRAAPLAQIRALSPPQSGG